MKTDHSHLQAAQALSATASLMQSVVQNNATALFCAASTDSLWADEHRHVSRCLSASHEAALTPPAAKPSPKQSALIRLPTETLGNILSHVEPNVGSDSLPLRGVSRAFFRASVLARPTLADHVASGFLRKVLNDGTNVAGA